MEENGTREESLVTSCGSWSKSLKHDVLWSLPVKAKLFSKLNTSQMRPKEHLYKSTKYVAKDPLLSVGVLGRGISWDAVDVRLGTVLFG